MKSMARHTNPHRHPGEGRDPVTITPIQAIRQLDSGLRRNDSYRINPHKDTHA